MAAGGRRRPGPRQLRYMDDPYDLQRFVAAQDAHGTYDRATAELRAGAKASQWMWFVLPKITGLGRSSVSRRYAICSLAEARAYLAHPVLGPRLVECATIVAGLAGRTAEQIFGGIDAQKLRSSMTLFLHADPGEPVFGRMLDQYFGGKPAPGARAPLLPARAGPGPPRPARRAASPGNRFTHLGATSPGRRRTPW